MKIIITENQHNSLKNKLTKLINSSGFIIGVKSVGGLKNLIKILYDDDYDSFIDDILDDLISNTYRSGHHYYLFDCNVSVFLDHSGRRPEFNFKPDCIHRVMIEKYGMGNSGVPNFIFKSLWERYSNYVIDRYVNEN
jgi:hypothetical protein